ncbi:TPA: hypothetical protein DIC38_02470 [Candidatus Nomurabacteria bacterium]|nr:MAG: hypothetical protein O210_OD1C00001G0237 [Parcubacteria bacterium RAAC4_OD1_1]HCY26519.1 hypothetical protein [Candidatus Nomurabacteria bacterium]
MQNEIKKCQNCKNDFIIEPEDFVFYEKIKVSPPTFCPECRVVRRMVWRNERALFRRICDFGGNNMITMFHPKANVKVYDRDIWWSDKWDPKDYGKEYDFSKPFFEQFKELISKVPLQNLGNNNCINSPYVNHALDLKNCYLVYASYLAEDTMYSLGASSLKNCFDTYKIQKCEECYEDSFCDSSYKTFFSFGADQSINSIFLKECINCQDCIGCVNLRNKKFCILNEQYLKEEYEKIKKELDFGSYKILNEFKNKYKNFILNYPNKYAGIIKSVDCVGDAILNSKNIKNCFDIYGLVEDSKYLIHGFDAKDSYDMYGFGVGTSLMYEGVDSGLKAFNNLFCVLNHGSIDTNYTYMCYNSKNLFGCIGIRKGEYCILNKQYTKEEYEKLIPKIIDHMSDMPYIDNKGRVYKYGEFFPPELSPFAYNETIAQEYYPKSKNSISEEGYLYRKPIERNYNVTIKSEDLPDHIKDVKDEIINEIISCPNNGNELTQCTLAYRIMPEELSFLRRHNIALPRYCPNCRHYERLSQRNPFKLWHRKCMKEGCNNEFETPYAPERPEIIYCEKCYQNEIY